ncbi:MAG: hypothetical protein K2M53_03410 [Muribaculaceae bacterium]|nr:hypothetical protein [Muribaculaceae bacterium]
MKRNLLFGLAVGTMAFSGLANNGRIEQSFNRDKVILPSSHYTGDQIWNADAWIINTHVAFGDRNRDDVYNHVWGTPADDANGKKWYEEGYTLTSGKADPSDLYDYKDEEIEWTNMSSPFTTDKWIASEIMGDIYLRRTFTLDEIPEGGIYLQCGRDDAPSEWYINGVKVHTESDGWDEGKVVLLTDEGKSALKVGENLMAVHVHQNWGGAYADCGLYGSDGYLYILDKGGEGSSWTCSYKLLDENEQIADAVAEGCFDVDADLTDWTPAMGPFSNGDDRWNITRWDSDNHPILIRRDFYLSASSLEALLDHGTIHITSSYDEFPVIYLNGTEIWRAEGWNDDNYATYTLTDDQKKLLREGDNVLGMSAQRGAGGGHAEYALYIDYPCEGYVYEEKADLSPLQSILESLINEANDIIDTATNLPFLDAALEAAEEALEEAKDADALNAAINTLREAVNTAKDSMGDIEAFMATTMLGVEDEEAYNQFAAASSREDFAKALQTLRYARRVAAADTHEDLFEGAKPEVGGKYYLYNVGRKQFLCGGSDWGAHAALGFPGVEITLDEQVADSENGCESFIIRTGLFNQDHDYLAYGGYMDGQRGDESDGWAFVPVDGKNNVFHMVQGGYPDVYVMWNPYGRTDAGNNDETNVCTESRNIDLQDLNAQWKLVTRAERNALIAEASAENPVDMTYYIASPNFSQRENIEPWIQVNTNTWGRGENHHELTLESYGSENMSVSQVVEGLPAGQYELSVQGYYRNGEIDPQLTNPAISHAYLFADLEKTELPNILEGNNQAPGEGTTRVVSTDDGDIVYNFPNSCNEAVRFFKSGLYKTTLSFNISDKTDEPVVAAEGEPTLHSVKIGVAKDKRDFEGDWIVLDNFRLKYLGGNSQNSVEDVEMAEEAIDGPIYNLQGIRVNDATVPGIYIQNGKKFIVK